MAFLAAGGGMAKVQPNMTYAQTLGYLTSFINYEQAPVWDYRQTVKLERFRGFLDAIGNPQAALRCIHVAGSKGKGSTCAFCANILRSAGYRVGLYTSPHLNDFRERIRILDPSVRSAGDFEGMIPKRDLARLATRLRPVLEHHARTSVYGRLTFFEVYTALAFSYFNEKKVDYAVLETGLGGRLDATNCVAAQVSVITPISFEHTDILGHTVARIAREKAGIIKKRPSIVVSARQPRQARSVIAHTCRKKGALLFEVGRDISFGKTREGFLVRGLFGTYGGLTTRLAGRHQIENAAAAIGAVESLRFYGSRIGAAAIRKGIRLTRWPGRCEVIARRPYVVLDGAQNKASADALVRAIRDTFTYRKLILVFGVSQDKDKAGMCSRLRPLADIVILTRANTPRATEPKKLMPLFQGKPVYETASVAEAKKMAQKTAGPDDLILVCGSLYVVGEYRQ